MFNNNNTNSSKEKDANRIQTLIGEQCYIIGSMNGNGLIKIDGSINGNLICEDDILLGETGTGKEVFIGKQAKERDFKNPRKTT